MLCAIDKDIKQERNTGGIYITSTSYYFTSFQVRAGSVLLTFEMIHSRLVGPGDLLSLRVQLHKFFLSHTGSEKEFLL